MADPQAADDVAVTDEDVTVSIDLLANDSDPDGDILGFSFTQPANGTVTRNPDDSVTYAPAADFFGTDAFDYTVIDAAGGESTASVAVTVAPVNDAPFADADAATVLAGGIVVVDVLAGDLDVEDGAPDPATVRLEEADDVAGRRKTVPGEGSWTVDPISGAVSFRPEPGYAGPVTDAFYTVADSENLRSAPAAISATILDPARRTLFAPDLAPTGETLAGLGEVELGVRFVANEAGRVTTLAYYRSEGDADDVDIRDARIWSATGALLAETTIVAQPGESGWRSAPLPAPVLIEPGAEYVASYRTLEPFLAAADFFASDYADASGVLAAPGGGNGVFIRGSGVVLPDQSEGSGNYWVDVSFVAVAPANMAPVFTGPEQFASAENARTVGAIAAADGEGDALSWRIAGGADAALFTIDPANGVLRFAAPPDYEAPADADGDNVYALTVAVSDGLAPELSRSLTVAVQDVVGDEASETSSLFGAGDTPALTKTTDPTDYELGVRFIPQISGEIVSLRYYRGAEDADDTDVRTLNLWTAAGALLGSASVIAAPGEDGWRIGSLSAPVPVAAGETYVASYGTIQNYSFSAGYFASGAASGDGVLVVPAGGNGVFSIAGPGTFPTQSFQSSNYWVDVEFRSPEPGPNAPPVAEDDSATVPINGATLIPVLDNDTDAEQGAPDPTTVEIAGADDASGRIRTVPGEGVWTVDPFTGAITFIPEADYAGQVAPISYTVADGEGLRSAPAQVSVAIVPLPPQENAIVLENQKPGVDQTIWDAPASARIEGFTTDISYDNGDVVSFKINLDTDDPAGAPYRIEIYRLGYYGGDGATLVATLDGLTGAAQPDPLTDPRGLVDAGNWSVSATWLSPEDAVSGVYLAKLVREDDGSTNQIPFVIREDEARPDGSKSDLVLQTSDTTWHAYNGWSGNNGQVGGNFYGGFDQPDDLLDDPGLNPDRSFAVSYNRPFLTRDFGGFASGPQDYLFGADYAAIYWLEQNGYDVSYISGVDADRLGPDALLGHKAYISVGHDEYWSGDQRANVEAARDAGVHLLFWSGNEVYWKTRYEPSIDASGQAFRTLVSYKETWNNLDSAAGPEDYADIDPSDQWTGTWRDLRFADAVDDQGLPTALGAVPENALTGQLFLADGNTSGAALDVPAEFAGLRVWRDTPVEGGGALDIAPGIIGYEWNVVPDDEWRPDGLITLSETTAAWPRVLIDQGNTTEPGTLTHNLSLYRAPSGALVFGAGTVFWTWGLSDRHDSSPYGAEIENPVIRQFTVNLLADMGVQPAAADAVLASQGIVRAFASADVTPATAVIDDLPASVSALSPVLITGVATDDDGDPATADGVVAGVEISFDGGATWSPAEGRETWSYVWSPRTEGAYEIRARALDDSLNLPAAVALASASVEVTAPVAPDVVSLLDPGVPFDGVVANDGTALELGLRFEAAESGRVVALRYYRTAIDAGDLDVRDGRLWTADGQLLATAEFSSGPGEVGWQSAALDQPVQILPDTEYVVSYRTDDFYSASAGAFGAGLEDPFGSLSAPGGANGVYAYGEAVVFPTQSFLSSNYWVDVAFEAAPLVNTAPVFTSAADVAVSENALLVDVVTAADGENDPLFFAIETGPDSARFTIDAATGALRFLVAPDFEAPADADADNVYELGVSVSDGTAPAVIRAMTVTVADVADESTPLYSTLFGAPDRPDATVTSDPTDYELGVKFAPATDGEIAGLRYWRGAADAGDTDARTLNLWTGTGALLASVPVVAGPGEDGWRTGLFGEPVAVTGGETYVASYGTEQNYAFSGSYFTEATTGPDGLLTAPASAVAGGNGVFSTAGPGSFPTGSYLASNYWVDPLFEADPVPSPTGFLARKVVQPPPDPEPFVSSDSFVIARDQVYVGRVVARDPDGDALAYAITGGKHARLFDMTEDGFLFFDPPGNGRGLGPNVTRTYALTVTASDGDDLAADQQLEVTVAPIRRPVGLGAAEPPGLVEFEAPEQILFRRTDPGGDADKGPADWLREAQSGDVFHPALSDPFEF